MIKFAFMRYNSHHSKNTLPRATLMNTSKKIKILIVDDNDQMRHILRLTFTRQGHYDIFEATEAKQAIAIFNDALPDIIFLDIMMPGEINGLDVCQFIKSSPIASRCFIVLLSSKVTQNDINQGLAAGADMYLIKPFSPLKLIEIVGKFNEKVSPPSPISTPTFPATPTNKEDERIDYTKLEGFSAERLEVLETMLGSQALVLKTIKSFIFDFAYHVEEINTALQTQDIETAKRKLHILKGCSADFGVSQVAILAENIEDILISHGDTYQKMLALSHAWRVVDQTVKTQFPSK